MRALRWAIFATLAACSQASEQTLVSAPAARAAIAADPDTAVLGKWEIVAINGAAPPQPLAATSEGAQPLSITFSREAGSAYAGYNGMGGPAIIDKGWVHMLHIMSTAIGCGDLNAQESLVSAIISGTAKLDLQDDGGGTVGQQCEWHAAAQAPAQRGGRERGSRSAFNCGRAVDISPPGRRRYGGRSHRGEPAI